MIGLDDEPGFSIAGNKAKVAGVAAGAGVVALGAVAVTRRRRKKKAKKKVRRSPSRRKTKKKKRGYKYARTAGKGRDRSTRRIRMTKNGQPYVILKSGKARFIKKSSARRSRKLKGGRY